MRHSCHVRCNAGFSIAKKGIEFFLFTTLMMFLLYNIKYIALPPSFYISSAVIFLVSLFYLVRGAPYPSALVRQVLVFLVFVIYGLTSCVLSSSYDGFIIKLLFALMFLIAVFPYAFLNYFKGREVAILEYIVAAGAINAFFIVVMFLFPGFRELYLSILSESDLLRVKGENIKDSFYAIRQIGITGSATYGMAVMQIIIAFVHVYYIILTEKNITVAHLSILSVLILSAILSGRTAFIGLFLLLAYIVAIRKNQLLFKFLAFQLTLFCIFLLWSKVVLSEEFFEFFIDWVFQIFVPGDRQTSLEVNKSMLSYYSISDFSFFGDFRWHGDEERTSYYMDTDVGWYRFLFAFGFIGLFLFLFVLMSFLRFPKKRIDLVSHFVMLYLFVVMFKGAIFFDVYSVFIILQAIYIMGRIKNQVQHPNSGKVRTWDSTTDILPLRSEPRSW